MNTIVFLQCVNNKREGKINVGKTEKHSAMLHFLTHFARVKFRLTSSVFNKIGFEISHAFSLYNFNIFFTLWLYRSKKSRIPRRTNERHRAKEENCRFNIDRNQCIWNLYTYFSARKWDYKDLTNFLLSLRRLMT
jgi:hypothetical protein